MAHVPGLRSGYARVGRLVYFGRMLDKIRLHAAGRLPTDYHANLGAGFDARTCIFLGVEYASLAARVRESDEEDLALLEWCHTQGGPRSDAACEFWNHFMRKVGWRDHRHPVLLQRIAEYGLTGKPIETFFDLNDYDEGRDPVATRAWELRAPTVVLMMGVSGSGKSTVGSALAAAMGWEFADADDFHPAANVAKMAAGQPLNDADREPWLAALHAHIVRTVRRDESIIVACSALKQRYRETLGAGVGDVRVVHLSGPRELLHARLQERPGHFMKPAMLDSQLETLEVPQDALVGDITQPPEVLVSQIRSALIA